MTSGVPSEPSAPGTQQSVKLPAGRYVAIRTIDDAGNVGALATLDRR